MKNLWLLLLFSTILFSIGAFGQKLGVINRQAIQFQIKNKRDTIDFIVVDTLLNKKKPIFLFCQGSQPKPLFIDFGNHDIFMFGGGISNFDISIIRRYYHLVVISMPKTPLIASVHHLNKEFSFITDSTKEDSYRLDYLKADYLENYVKRANIVISYLHKQDWVDKSQLVAFGHSQGIHIVSELANTNKKITRIGLSGANLFGRIDQLVREERVRAEKGEITWEVADKNMDYWYNFWEQANTPQMLKDYPQLLPWKSFSKPSIYTLIKLKIPIYLTYGTADLASSLCDVVPLVFISNGKKNLTIKRRFGLDHNFFELDKNGNPDYSKCHWNDVMREFVEWTLTKK